MAAQAVLLEIRVDVDEPWRQVGPQVTAADNRGSVTREEPSGRRVYLFGFQDGRPGVWLSSAGADVVAGQRKQRLVVSLGLEQVSDLAEPFELPPARSWLAVRSDMVAPTYDAPALRVRLVDE